MQTSAVEEVDQISAICKKKTVCFLTSASCLVQKHVLVGCHQSLTPFFMYTVQKHEQNYHS
ncbi:hypothetical protein HanIR_Chr09g0401991 [Helianthus annuus]|nr:hypothetical protein HanIR_Chr09g0401991 [Helianthus annuus]